MQVNKDQMTNKYIYIYTICAREHLHLFPFFLPWLPNLSPHCNLLFFFCWVCMHEKGPEALRSLLTKGKSELFGFCMCCIPAPLMIVIELAKYTPKNFLKMTARGFLSNRPASILAKPLTMSTTKKSYSQAFVLLESK